VNVTCDLGFVRNSAGPDNYVSDEIITSRAGVRVLIGNTDAEGRMVMGDLLCHAKERVLSKEFGSAPSRLFTVATLTGHAIRAMGVGYSISMDNGPAREAGVSKRLFEAGHLIADPFETSTLRREDYELVKPGALTEDVVQANDKPSTMTNRGIVFEF
jgi:leucyl aminopeptidase